MKPVTVDDVVEGMVLTWGIIVGFGLGAAACLQFGNVVNMTLKGVL